MKSQIKYNTSDTTHQVPNKTRSNSFSLEINPNFTHCRSMTHFNSTLININYTNVSTINVEHWLEIQVFFRRIIQEEKETFQLAVYKSYNLKLKDKSTHHTMFIFSSTFYFLSNINKNLVILTFGRLLLQFEVQVFQKITFEIKSTNRM